MTSLPCLSRVITTVCLALALLAGCGDRSTTRNEDASSMQRDDAPDTASTASSAASVAVDPSLRVRLGIELAPIGHADLKVTAGNPTDFRRNRKEFRAPSSSSTTNTVPVVAGCRGLDTELIPRRTEGA